ncbi:MAG: hypothetical protein ABIO04_03760 [Ferruginibacter sp.]
MNKYIKTFFALLGLSAIILSSCKKNNLVIDQDIVPPSYARFNTLIQADSSAIYYIKATNDVFKLPISVTTVSDKDRTIHFSYTSNTAVEGQQFSAPTSLTIPAGKVLDTLQFAGLFAGYPLSSRIDTVIVKITDDGDIPGSTYTGPRKNTYKLILRKYCEVMLTDYAGTYNNTIDMQTGSPNYGPYVTSFSNIVQVPGTSTATATIDNFWDVGTSINVTLDWTSPSNFKALIAPQILYNDPTYGPITITGIATPPGTFSSCENTFSFSYKITAAAGSFGNFVTTIAR